MLRASGFAGSAAHSSQMSRRPPWLRSWLRLPSAGSVRFSSRISSGSRPCRRPATPEEVRELLSRYFDTCRRLVERYGGVVEKFIGDAVMAVWGTPVAQEDDAERAVRTALDLVAAVSALGDEVGATELRGASGVLTGEAAVTLGASAKAWSPATWSTRRRGSRRRPSRPPSWWRGDATGDRAGDRVRGRGRARAEGQGRAGSRCVAPCESSARSGGALRSDGLEAPFVGRERELRLVKELFHASAESHARSWSRWRDRRHRQVAARVGVREVRRRPGRRRSGGTAAAASPTARASRSGRWRDGADAGGIAEGEAPDSPRAKLAAWLEEHVPDAEERAWVGPRLANLLGLEERAIPTARISSPRGGCSSSGWPTRARW